MNEPHPTRPSAMNAKPLSRSLALALALGLSLAPSGLIRAATTIDPANPYAYAANAGWIHCRGDTNNGAVIGEYVCSGYLWAANLGWIHLGSGNPANGIQYQNNSSADYGVNHDGLGNLRGYAWGANIGWISFENTGAPKVDLWTGRLSGYVWSANCGWISLSNAIAQVRTLAIRPGADSDGDGIPDAWELSYTNNLSAFSASSDSDGDGVSDLGEYVAGTHPLDAADFLRITSFVRGLLGDPTRLDMQWSSKPSRFYAIQRSLKLASDPFTDMAVFPWPGINNAAWLDAATNAFYRVRAFRPLTP